MIPADILVNAPRLTSGTRVLIAGASGGLGRETLRVLAQSEVVIGAHYCTHQQLLLQVAEENTLPPERFRLFQADLRTATAARSLVEAFVAWAKGIDAVVQLTGGISQPVSWHQLTEEHWYADLDLNLTAPFFMAQAAMRFMQDTGGKIILTSTASAQHGGGATSMAYGVAKAGIECLTKGLAREGARHKILVNAICPGFIQTEFHTLRMHRSRSDLQRRAELVPLRRAGTPMEVAGLIAFLLSPWGDYITGECIPISGGDRL